MNPLWWLWLQFGVCSALIWVGGTQLLKHGDTIARLTGLSGTWVGVVLLATVTSVPELVSGVTAVTAADAPDVAVGDVLGSCVFNLAMIAVLDALQRPKSLFSLADRGHVIGAGFSVLTLALVGAALLPATLFGTIAHVGFESPVLVVLYAVAMREIYGHQKATHRPNAAAPAGSSTLRRACVQYAAAATLVIAAAVWLPFLGADIAKAMGWAQSFVGTLLIALTTSLPELTVTIAAVRVGAIDMAIGNLIGSNLFNMLVLAIDDALYLPGRLLSAVSPLHAVSVFSATAMTGAVVIALIAPPRARLLNAVSWTSVLLVLLFFGNAWMHYRQPA